MEKMPDQQDITLYSSNCFDMITKKRADTRFEERRERENGTKT